MTYARPKAYEGEYLRNTQSALWLIPYYTIKHDKPSLPEHHILVRDPHITRADKDNMHFLHTPSRKLFPHEILKTDKGHEVVDLDSAARNILTYYTGQELKGSPITGTQLHHEATNVFSGPQENRQVVVCLIRMNDVVKSADPYVLPPILTTAEGGTVPAAIAGKPDLIVTADALRSYTGWTSAHKLLAGIRRVGLPTDEIYAPSETPFFATNLVITNGGEGNPVKKTYDFLPVQGTMLYVLQKAAEILYPENPEVYQESNARLRITESDLVRARKADRLQTALKTGVPAP